MPVDGRAEMAGGGGRKGTGGRLVAPGEILLLGGQVGEGAIRVAIVQRIGEGRTVANLVRDLAEQFQRRAPDHGVLVDPQEAQRHKHGLLALLGNAEVVLEFLRPGDSGPLGSLHDDPRGLQLHVGGGHAQAAVGVQDGIAQQDFESVEEFHLGLGPRAVQRPNIAGGAVVVEHRHPALFFDVFGDDAGRVAADQGAAAAQHGPVHGVVGDQRQRTAIGLVQPQQADAAVYGRARVQAQTHLAVGIARAAVDVRLRIPPANPQPGALQLRSGLPHAVLQGLFHQARVGLIQRKLKTVAHEHAGNAWRAHIGRRMRVGHGPPDVLRRQAELLGKIAGDAVTESGREGTDVRRDEEEQSRPVIHCDDAVIDPVVYLGGHARAVTAQHLRRIRRDVHLDHGSAELRGAKTGNDAEKETPCAKQAHRRTLPALSIHTTWLPKASHSTRTSTPGVYGASRFSLEGSLCSSVRSPIPRRGCSLVASGADVFGVCPWPIAALECS